MESANVPFDGIESEQHRRDLYFRLQVQLATIARTQNDVNEANEVFSKIGMGIEMGDEMGLVMLFFDTLLTA